MQLLWRWVTTRYTHINIAPQAYSRLVPLRRKKLQLENNLNLYASSSLLAFTPSSEPPSVSLLFSVLIGLPIALWTYKCLAMVLFQRKIIYMGYIPPGTRQEKLSNAPYLHKIRKDYSLEEIRIPSEKRVILSALTMSQKSTDKPNCIILYLQGNAGNPLHRIPVFTSLFSSPMHRDISPIILAPAPRSYWSSTNRTPTQRGILADYKAALRYAARRWPHTPIVLYGHSLGGAIAVCLLESLDSEQDGEVREALKGLILENPFASIPEMVHALYPQRWLPYRRLGPLAWDKWDALSAMRASVSTSPIADHLTSRYEVRSAPIEKTNSVLPRLARNMLVLLSSRDEVVPPSMGRSIFSAATQRTESDNSKHEPEKDAARLVEIDGALHEDAWRQRQWRTEMGRYLDQVARR